MQDASCVAPLCESLRAASSLKTRNTRRKAFDAPGVNNNARTKHAAGKEMNPGVAVSHGPSDPPSSAARASANAHANSTDTWMNDAEVKMQRLLHILSRMFRNWMQMHKFQTCCTTMSSCQRCCNAQTTGACESVRVEPTRVVKIVRIREYLTVRALHMRVYVVCQKPVVVWPWRVCVCCW